MGWNGMISMCASPVLLLAAHWFGFEEFRPPSGTILVVLTLNALIGSTFANYLYTSAVLLLSPLVATVCMSLSIPLSAFVDGVLLQEHQFSTGWLMGAGLVAGSAVLAAVDAADPAVVALPNTKSSSVLAPRGRAGCLADRWRGQTGDAPASGVYDPRKRYKLEAQTAQGHELRSLLAPETDSHDEGEEEGDEHVLDRDAEDALSQGDNAKDMALHPQTLQVAAAVAPERQKSLHRQGVLSYARSGRIGSRPPAMKASASPMMPVGGMSCVGFARLSQRMCPL